MILMTWLWAATLLQQDPLSGHTFGDVFRVAYGEKTPAFVTGNNLEVCLWRFPTPAAPVRIPLTANKTYALNALALNEKLIAIGEDSAIALHDSTSGELVRRIPISGDGGVSSLAFSRDGKQLWACAAGEDGDYAKNGLNVYDVESGKRATQLYKAAVGDRMTGAIVFAHTADLAVLLDGTLKRASVEVYEASSYKKKKFIKLAKPEIQIGVFSPDDKRFYLGAGRRVQVYDVASWKVTKEWVAHVGTKQDDMGYVRALQVSDDGRWLVTQSDDKEAVRVWDTASYKQVASAPHQVGRAWNLVASGDLSTLVVTGNKKQLQTLHFSPQ